MCVSDLLTPFMFSMFLFRSNEIIELREYSRNEDEPEGQPSINNGADAGEGRMPRTILDPQGPFLYRSNKILPVSCVIAVSVDS